MKNKLLLLFFVGLLASCATQNTVSLKGTYKGKNLFIENPECGGTESYSIESLSINGKKIADEIKSSALEIDLKQMGMKEGETITVEIKCKGDCKARILNSEAF